MSDLELPNGNSRPNEARFVLPFFEDRTVKSFELLPGDHKRTATVTAATPMRLLVMFGPEFSGIADQMPEVHDEVRRVLADRLSRA